MQKNILHVIATGAINALLMEGFDCTNAEKMSTHGIQFIENTNMYYLQFDIDDKLIGPSIYSVMVAGEYIAYSNKFYPFIVVACDYKDKSNYYNIDIQNLIISMVDVDNKYNELGSWGTLPKTEIRNKILNYEFIKGDRNYIEISLNSFNSDNAISKALDEGITCTRDKFEGVYKDNKILISEDLNSGKFRIEYLNSIERRVIFENTDIHKFYKFLEEETLKILMTEKIEKNLSRKQIKKYRAIRIQSAVNELLEECVYTLEEEVLKIQTEELVKASDLLFEQYEYNYAILDELNKVLIEESTMLNVDKIISNGLSKKFDCCDFLAQKSYLYKPKQYMSFVFDNLLNKDIYECIDEDIRDYVKVKFLKELDSYQRKIIQPEIHKQSSIFVKEIDDLNKIVDEIQELIELIKSNRIEKNNIIENITIKKDKINKSFRFKLKSTYKQLHQFATQLGFKSVRQNATSHLIYKRNSISVPIPNKRGDVKPGLLLTIIKQLGSNRDEFYSFITKDKF